MKISTSVLIGAPLDYMVAMAEGFVWARNTIKRSGDSYRREGSPEQWPVGSRFLIAPNHSKGLRRGQPNWDGWLPAEMSDPIGPNWNYGLPGYSTLPAQGFPILEREISNHQKRDGYFYCNKFVKGQAIFAYGPTLLIAAMRCYVASVFGNIVEVPDDLVYENC